MQKGMDELTHGDSAAAYADLRSILAKYPTDLALLRPRAAAGMASGHDADALSLFRQALAQRPSDPWRLRLAAIVLEARLGRWNEFDRDVEALRVAKKNGMDHGLDGSSGFVIDEFNIGTGKVQGVIYPQQLSRYHTLCRFSLPQQAELNAPTPAGATSSTSSARCHNPDFQPYMDVESDDVDQAAFKKANPDKAAKGERSYSLDSYPAPCSQR